MHTLADELKNNYTIAKCNLSNSAECVSLITNIEHIDIMVCNAGIVRDILAIKMSDAMFDEVININLKSSFILNREAIKKMLQNSNFFKSQLTKSMVI